VPLRCDFRELEMRVDTSAYKSRFTTQPRRYGAAVFCEWPHAVNDGASSTFFAACCEADPDRPPGWTGRGLFARANPLRKYLWPKN